MEDYIVRSSQVLSENLPRAKKLVAPLVSRFSLSDSTELRFIASGSSYNACVTMRPCVERLTGMRAEVLTPSAYEECLDRLETIAPRAFEVFVSQSGCSTNILEAIERAKSAGHEAVGLTGNMDSEMAAVVDEIIEWGVGNETIDFVTLGVATLMEFLAFFSIEAARCLGRIADREVDAWMDQMDRIPDLHASVLDQVRNLFVRDERTFLAPGPVFMCGCGPAWGLALEGALKWQETLKAPAMAYEPEEYIHGPNMQIAPSYAAFFINAVPSGERVREIYRATREVTEHAYLIDAYAPVQGDGNDRHIVGVDSCIDSVLSPIALLPALQYIPAHGMRVLDCEETHPLFERFEKRVHCKTADYDDVMARKLTAAQGD